MTAHPIPDEALDSDIAIIARKGSGKSYLARGIAERILDLGRRIVVIDPLGAWWGLRSSADGQSAGYPVAVFGGDHGDMPLTAAMGEPLAKLISAENFPCVIDTSLMRKEEQGQLAIDLFEGLFRFNKDALTIVLEEADVFAPQNPAKDGYAARVLHEVDRIARRGRARGLRLISLTQRPARLHKDVLSQAATLVAMRLTSPHDQAAIEDWIKGNADSSQAREVMGSLATLPVGSGWIWAPDLDMLKKVAFPRIKTLDTSATPKAGETRVEPKTLAEVDVSAIREALSISAPSNEAQKMNTGGKRDIDAAEGRGYQRGIADWRIGFEREAQASFAELGRQIEAAFAPLRAAAQAEAIGAPPAPVSVPANNVSAVPKKPAHRQAAAPREASENDGATAAPGSAAMSMLDTLVEAYPSALTAHLWGTFSGRSPVSGPWHKAVRELRDAGLILGDQHGFTATSEGVARAQTKPANIGSQVEIWSHWRVTIRSKLGSAAVEMLGCLAAQRPNRLTARQWGLLTNRSPVSGPWHGAIRDLVKWDCIEKIGDAFSITDKGVQIADVVGGADTRATLTALRIERLTGLARQIYDALPGERADLAKRLGKSSISGPWHSAIKEVLASGLAAETNKTLHRIDEDVA